MIIDCGSYRIVPYPGNTCWSIQKRAVDPNAKNQWHKPRYYPSSITHAIKHVFELQLREADVDVRVEEALPEIQAIADNLLESVARAVGEDASGFLSANNGVVDVDADDAIDEYILDEPFEDDVLLEEEESN